MAAKLKIVLFVSVLLAPSIAFAQSSSGSAQIRLRGRGRSLILVSGKVRRALDVKEEILAARLDEVKLLLVTRRAGLTYLLVDACGPSKAVPDARQCGAADECALLWIKLDGAWKISEMKAARYESCWQSSSSADGYKLSGRRLFMEYDDFSQSKSYRVSYDAEQPERGLSMEESALQARGR